MELAAKDESTNATHRHQKRHHHRQEPARDVFELPRQYLTPLLNIHDTDEEAKNVTQKQQYDAQKGHPVCHRNNEMHHHGPEVYPAHKGEVWRPTRRYQLVHRIAEDGDGPSDAHDAERLSRKEPKHHSRKRGAHQHLVNSIQIVGLVKHVLGKGNGRQQIGEKDKER